MAKQQQSKSKTAYRQFVTVSRMLLDHGRGETVKNELEMSDRIAEMMARVEDESAKIFGGVIFSNAQNVNLWEQRFKERAEYIRDKLVEFYYDQLYKDESDEEEEAQRDAAAFGTDLETWLDFLALGIDWSISTKERAGERVTAYTDLTDLLNDFAHISSAVEHVRFTGRFYKIKVTDSARGGRRRARARGSS